MTAAQDMNTDFEGRLFKTWGINPQTQKDFSMRPGTLEGRPGAIYPSGEGKRERIAWTDGNKPKYKWMYPDDRPQSDFYTLPDNAAFQIAESEGFLIVTNGEKATWALDSVGIFNTVSLFGESSKITALIEAINQWQGIKAVWLFPDIDKAGETAAHKWHAGESELNAALIIPDMGAYLKAAHSITDCEGWDLRDVLQNVANRNGNKMREIMEAMHEYPMLIDSAPLPAPAKRRIPSTDDDLNPELIRAVESHLESIGKTVGSNEIRIPSWAPHKHDKPGLHATYYRDSRTAFEHSRNETYLIKDLCEWQGINPADYGGFYLKSSNDTRERKETPKTEPESIPYPGTDFVEKCLYHEESGDADLFARMYRNRVIFDSVENRWYVWNGHYWELDRTGQIKLLISGEVAAQYERAYAEIGKKLAFAGEDKEAIAQIEKQREKLRKNAAKLRTRRGIENALNLAQSRLAFVGTWDKKPYKLAVQNGVINLQTGQLEAGNPTDYIRTAAPIEYQGLDTPAPRWEQFLSEIFDNDTELIDFVGRLSGWASTGLPADLLPIFCGVGRNGKDTFCKQISAAMGNKLAGYGTEDLIISRGKEQSGGASPHLTDLYGARIRFIAESSENATLNANLVKNITGTSHIKARGLYAPHYLEFDSTHIVILMTNHKPKIPNGGDYALWARLLLIPFDMSFVEHPKALNERKKDPELDRKLAAESAGILAWLVRGCLDWQRVGLNPPAKVLHATQEYKNDEDDITPFIEVCCVTGNTAYTCRANQLFEAYEAWGGTLNQTSFGRRMGERFTKDTDRRGTFYKGIGLSHDDKNDE